MPIPKPWRVPNEGGHKYDPGWTQCSGSSYYPESYQILETEPIQVAPILMDCTYCGTRNANKDNMFQCLACGAPL